MFNAQVMKPTFIFTAIVIIPSGKTTNRMLVGLHYVFYCAINVFLRCRENFTVIILRHFQHQCQRMITVTSFPLFLSTRPLSSPRPALLSALPHWPRAWNRLRLSIWVNEFSFFRGKPKWPSLSFLLHSLSIPGLVTALDFKLYPHIASDPWWT